MFSSYLFLFNSHVFFPPKVRYEFRTDEFPDYGFTPLPQIGWIAQDVQKVLPEIVVKNEETGYYSVAYSHACPLLAEGIKELKQQHEKDIERLETDYQGKIDSLQKEIKELKEMMFKLLSK
jgi:hypothetical protein